MPVTVDGVNAVAKLYITEEIGNKNTFYLTKIETVSTESTGLNTKEIVPNSSVNTADYSISDLFEFVKKNEYRFEADSKRPTNF